MRPGWFVPVQSLFFALLLHAVMIVLLLVSFSFTPRLKPVKPVSIVEAVTVDKAKVEQEVRRLKEEEDKKFRAEKRRLEELLKKLKEEEKQLASVKQRK